MAARRLALAAAALALAGACDQGRRASPVPAPNPEVSFPVPAFSLTDRNAGSPTSGQPVQPNLYLGKVAVYYFAEAT